MFEVPNGNWISSYEIKKYFKKSFYLIKTFWGSKINFFPKKHPPFDIEEKKL